MIHALHPAGGRLAGRLVALGLGLLVVLGASAENAFITEGLEVGVHESPSPNSAVVALISSGAVVEILERKDEIARVRLEDDTVGWVDARYLTEQPPAAAQLRELRASIEEQNRELARARQLLRELEQALALQEGKAQTAEAATAEVRAELEIVQSVLAAATAENRLAESEETQLTSDTLRELQAMAEENHQLKQVIAELEAMQAMAAEQLEKAQAALPPDLDLDLDLDPAPPEPESVSEAQPSPLAVGLLEPTPDVIDVEAIAEHYTGILRWQVWQWILLAGALLLAFGTGAYLVDWSVRRRHGGFRV